MLAHAHQAVASIGGRRPLAAEGEGLPLSKSSVSDFALALGDVATWVSAIGTVFAVVVALWFSGRDGGGGARRSVVVSKQSELPLG